MDRVDFINTCTENAPYISLVKVATNKNGHINSFIDNLCMRNNQLFSLRSYIYGNYSISHQSTCLFSFTPIPTKYMSENYKPTKLNSTLTIYNNKKRKYNVKYQ